MTTTQTGSFDYTIPAEYYGDYASDYDTDAINADVCDALNALLPEGVSIARNGMVFAELDAADVARGLDFAELLESIDVDSIVIRHEIN